MIWGSESKTCGPIYLDMNIYPEYQKSMTVDTGLVGAGNGGFDIPIFTSCSENWNMSANGDKVNKSLAERVTTNALRESVSGMYTGEICVVGDPSVKPYDRISITDTYEDMVGQMEVEAVVYSMNFNTGFTTTIYPDLIVKMDDPHEVSAQNLFGNITAAFVAAVPTRIGLVTALSGTSSKVLTAAATFVNKLSVASATNALAAKQISSTAICKYLGIASGKSTLGSLATIAGSISIPGWVSMAIVAATVYVLTRNAKSFITRWIRNIQALDVYPIFKNQRPYIAGMNGHRGAVRGYDYTKDSEDSIQYIVAKTIDGIKDFGGVKGCSVGEVLLAPFLDSNEYDKILQSWSQTLPGLAGAEEFEAIQNDNGYLNSVEQVYQNAYNSVSTEFANRSNNTKMLRTKYRIRSYNTNNGSSPTYLQYRNLGVLIDRNINKTDENGKEIAPEPIKYKNNSATDVYPSSIYTNKNILSLYPIEDDPDIKKAVEEAHANVKKLSIAHATGNMEVYLSFESGTRKIKFNAEANPNETFADFPIYDMPMLQEDALYVLKFILNDQNLKDKELEFISGARINDIRTWKNTGFCFELKCKDATALTNAVKAVKEYTMWTMNGKTLPLFTYKMSEDVCVIAVYAEEKHNTKKESE